MDAMPRCKLISRLGVGVDNIDVPAATHRGIWVANVPDYGVDEVSLHAMSLLLAQLRGLPRLVADTRSGKWTLSPVKPIARLTGQTLGIVGFGRIGRSLATKAAGFGLRLLACDPYLDAAGIRAAGAQPVDLETLLHESDFVSLHLPLNDETRHIIGARTLAMMKPSAYLINTARGELIDEVALLAAVRAGQIRGAALDVLSVEPPPVDHPVLSELLKEERILVTPHGAWYSEEAMTDMRARATENVVRVLRGEQPRTPVNQI
jgi:D-3-phosphoglycerate dehydrogenase